MEYAKTETLDAFSRRFRYELTEEQSRYAFFLGAGCSVTSGIKAAGSLVRDVWLPKLVKIKNSDSITVQQWATANIDGYDHANPAGSYGAVMEALFNTAAKRQHEIDRITREGRPGYGYSMLARLLSDPTHGPRCNVVLTTNFDDLVADALYLFGRESARPLVIGHELLMGFVQVTRTAPMVVKLHHDRHLAPLNTATEIDKFGERVTGPLHNLLKERGLIFIGYGGNDPSVTKALTELSDESLPYGVVWINDAWPNGDLGKWLESRDTLWIKHRDFDQAMFMLSKEFDLERPPSADAVTKLFEANESKYRELVKEMGGSQAPEDEGKRKAAKESAKKYSSGFEAAVAAEAIRESNPIEAEKIYLQGIQEHPDEALLLGSYASFLHFIKKQHDISEKYYIKSTKNKEKSASANGNYALFLGSIRRDFDSAEKHFKRALEADPKNAVNLGNYALFMEKYRKNFDTAEEYYKHALEADPENAVNLGNYAVFLKNIRKDFDGAKKHYKLALDVNPKNVANLARYAILLKNICKDFDGAEEYFKRALDADPKNANNLGNYAGHLFAQGRTDKGSGMLKRCEAEAPEPDLLLECHFYRLCHVASAEERYALVIIIKDALRSGVRSPHFDLSQNVERARIDGHLWADMLDVLAKVIAEDADIGALDAFEEWRDA